MRGVARREIARRSIPGIVIIACATLAIGYLADHHRDAPGAYLATTLATLAAALLRIPALRALHRENAPDGSSRDAWVLPAMLALPFTWGCYSGFILVSYGGGWLDAAILAFTAAIASNVVSALGMWRTLALSYVVTLLLPTLAAGVQLAHPLGAGVALGCGLYAVYLVAQIANANAFYWRSAIATAELAQQGHELAEAKSRAEAANRAKSEFLTRMSHELRTPMNAVLGFAQLIEYGADNPDEVRRNGAEIRAAGRHLMALIDEILDLSRIEAGRLALELSTVDSVALARGVIDSLEVAAAPGVTVSLAVPVTPPAIVTDPLRLRQVLVNLVGNAVKFTEHGEVEVAIGTRDGRELVITIRDTGIGIPAALAEAVFAPFAQADTSATRRFGGTGLGLPISRELVELMGGRLSFDSVEGRGTTFVLALPLNGPSPTVAEDEDSPARGALEAGPGRVGADRSN